MREIRDRSVLRLFESNEVAAAPQILSGSPGIPQALPQQGHWDQDVVGLGDPVSQRNFSWKFESKSYRIQPEKKVQSYSETNDKSFLLSKH